MRMKCSCHEVVKTRKEFRLRNSRLRRSQCDIYLIRRSAHPPEGFCSIGKFGEVFYRTKKRPHPLQKRDEVIIRGTTLIPMDTPRALCCCVTYSLRHSLLSKAKGFAASAPSQRRTLSYSGSGIQLAWEIRSSSELKRTFSR